MLQQAHGIFEMVTITTAVIAAIAATAAIAAIAVLQQGNPAMQVWTPFYTYSTKTSRRLVSSVQRST